MKIFSSKNKTNTNRYEVDMTSGSLLPKILVFSIGSALDIFGGNLKFENVLQMV